MFLYIRNIQYDALFIYYPKNGPYLLNMWCYTTQFDVRTFKAPTYMGLYLGCVLYILCTIYIFKMAIVSRIQFVLRHMCFVREVINLI